MAICVKRTSKRKDFFQWWFEFWFK